MRWAILNGVLAYIQANVDRVRADLRATCLAKKQSRACDKAAGIKKRRADRTFVHAVRVHRDKTFRPTQSSSATHESDT